MKRIFNLRLEEFLALLFFIPSLLITIKANLYFIEMGMNIPRRYYGGLTRLAVTLALMIAFYYFVKYRPLWKYTWWLREVMPFLFCIAIYTNMHDTIGFVNPHDVHDTLIRIEEWLFGVQPVLWAQQFYHPWLTDYFSISYMNYFIIAVVVVLYLLVKNRPLEMRKVLIGTILSFYFGYFLYILFPAAPPRLTLAAEFTRDFSGGFITHMQNKLINLNPSSSRAAFPSLHCAVTLISLMYAFKYSKKLFFVLLVPGISLVLATVYLRHHYVVDIIAGFALAIFTYFVAPHIDSWWNNLRRKYATVDDRLLQLQEQEFTPHDTFVGSNT
ncbi:phosphatase PAP2 family protein [Calditrichota bacterium GD2]